MKTPNEQPLFDVDGELIIPNSIKTTDMIDQCLSELHFYKSSIRQIESKMALLEDTLKHYIDENEFLLNAKGEKVATYKKYVRETFDKEKFKEKFPELYDDYIKQTPYRTLRIY